MKFIVLVYPADLKAYEAGTIFDQPEVQAQMEEMGKFNDTLAADNMMLTADGLKETSKGARIDFDKNGGKVMDGPFKNLDNLVCGFWLLEAKSKEEVVRRMSKVPMQPGDRLEIRQLEEAV